MGINDIIPVLQTAVGPVILISGAALLLLSMTNRLGRTVDRMRAISDLQRQASDADLARYESQLAVLWKRAHLMRTAISLAAGAALIAAVMVIVIFVGALLQLHIVTIVVVLFVGCMAAIIASLIFFLRDIDLALHAMALELGFEKK